MVYAFLAFSKIRQTRYCIQKEVYRGSTRSPLLVLLCIQDVCNSCFFVKVYRGKIFRYTVVRHFEFLTGLEFWL